MQCHNVLAFELEQQSNTNSTKSEFGGSKPKVPLTGIQGQHPAPAPHVRHDRSMARNRLVARAFSGFGASLCQGAASNVHWPKWCCVTRFCYTYKLILTFLEYMESTRIRRFEAQCKNNGFAKGTFESPSTHAIRMAEYQHFAIYNHVIWDGPVDLSSEAFWIAFVPIFISLHTCNEILRVPCLTLIWNRAKLGSRMVLRDQEMFPEVWNRPLLPSFIFSHSTFRNSLLIM